MFFFHLFLVQLLKREPGQISFPLDFRHTITVKHTALRDDVKRNTPPGSPASRYRAIARKHLSHLYSNSSFQFCAFYIKASSDFFESLK